MVHKTNKRAAAEICYRFSELNIGVKPIEVAEKIEEWRVLGMTAEHAKTHMANVMRHRHNITPTQYKQAADNAPDKTPLNTINSDGNTITVVATIAELWNATNNKINQAGLLEDETSKLKFVSFDDDAPTLTQNDEYIIENAVTSKFNGKYEVVINEATTITPLDKSINTNTTTKELEQQHLDDEHGPTTDPINPETIHTTNAPTNTDSDDTILGTVTDITTTLNAQDAYTASLTINTTNDETTTVTLTTDLVSDVIGVNATSDNIPRDNVTQTLEDTMLAQWVETTLTDTDSNNTLVTDLTINPEVETEHIDTIADAYTDN